MWQKGLIASKHIVYTAVSMTDDSHVLPAFCRVWNGNMIGCYRSMMPYRKKCRAWVASHTLQPTRRVHERITAIETVADC